MLLGGGLAFSVFVCCVPLVLIIFSVLGAVLEASSVKIQVTSFIDTIIPYPEYALYVKGIIFSRIDEVIRHKRLAGYLGVGGLLVAASGLFSSLRTVLNAVFGVTEGKNVVVGKLRDFGMVLVVLISFLVSTIALTALEVARESADRIGFLRYSRFGTMGEGSISVLSFCIVFVICSAIYYLVPYDDLGKKVVALSALWAALLWELAKQAFGYYVAHFASVGRIYGTYVMIVVVAFWIYYSCVVLILGAEIGQLYRQRPPGRLGMGEHA
jgi:membrane protein